VRSGLARNHVLDFPVTIALARAAARESLDFGVGGRSSEASDLVLTAIPEDRLVLGALGVSVSEGFPRSQWRFGRVLVNSRHPVISGRCCLSVVTGTWEWLRGWSQLRSLIMPAASERSQGSGKNYKVTTRQCSIYLTFLHSLAVSLAVSSQLSMLFNVLQSICTYVRLPLLLHDPLQRESLRFNQSQIQLSFLLNIRLIHSSIKDFISKLRYITINSSTTLVYHCPLNFPYISKE
jgi:hypothetical protein